MRACKIFVLLVILSLITPLISSAYYTIYLKNGRQFRTDNYWEENDKVVFYLRGGVIGIEKNYVEKIVETNERETSYIYKNETDDSGNTNGQEKSYLQRSQEISEHQTQQKRYGDVEKSGSQSKSDERVKDDIDVDYYKKAQSELKGKIDESIKKFRKASGSKNTQLKQEAMKEISAFSKQLYDLQDELKEKNDGELPKWWEKL